MDAGNIPWKPMVILEQSMVGASKNIQKIWNLDNLIIALDRRYFSYVDVSRISLNRFSPHPGCFLERRFCFFFVGKAETNHKCFWFGWFNTYSRWLLTSFAEHGGVKSNPMIVAFHMFGSLLSHNAMEAILFPYAPWNMYQTCSCHSGNVGQFPSQSIIFYFTVIHSNSVHISAYYIYNYFYTYI